MHIICASYHNIGPFEGQTISVCLHQGSYLIKAPIGSGKSFLFFDGLVFALYGYSKRDMLNVNSDAGWTKVLFVDDEGDCYFIVRPLSGKKGVQLFKNSKFKIQNSKGIENLNTNSKNLESVIFNFESLPEVINYDRDFSDYLDMSEFEAIDFHRANEIQQHIELLLPPRSVFLQRHILMQDSENIFELQPKARIDVLKLMFGLDMIDSIKDKIGDIKNDLKGQFKVLGESTHLEQQYAKWYEDLKSCVGHIQARHKQTVVADRVGHSDIVSLCDSLLANFEEIGITDFIQDPLSVQVDSLDYQMSQRTTDKRIQIIQHITEKKFQLNSDVSAGKSQLEALEKEQQTISKRLKELELTMSGMQEAQTHAENTQEKLADLQSLKLSHQHQLQAIDSLIKPDFREVFKKYDIDTSSKDVLGFMDGIGQLVALGKIKKSELESFQAKYSLFQHKIETKGEQLQSVLSQLETIKDQQRRNHLSVLDNSIVQLERSLESIAQQKTMLLSQQGSLGDAMVSIDNQILAKETFYCSKIEANCPFVEQIRDSSTKHLHAQKQTIVQQMNDLLQQSQALDLQTLDLQKELLSLQNTRGSIKQDDFHFSGTEYDQLVSQSKLLQIGDLSNGEKLEQSNLQFSIQSLEGSINSMLQDYKMLNAVMPIDQFENYKTILQEQKQCDQDIISLQRLINANNENASQYLLLKNEQQQLIENKSKHTIQYDELSRTRNVGLSVLETPLFSSLDSLVQLSKQCTILLSKVKDMYAEKLRISEQSKIIKDELEQASLLHAVFGKELTLYVLQSSLPLLNEYINAFLAKVVNFQLQIQVNADGDELELTIVDDFGTREVKSLSGGQRTILRLCWILATSVVFRNSFLLLDETINNLDNAIVSRVAELLTDYVRQHNLTLYIVTHSEQIQAMSIWDKVIEVGSAKL